jgi:hypothetical protein
MKRLALTTIVAIGAFCSPARAIAQSVTTGISRDTVRVGDPVRVILRIDNVPAGTEIVLPDSLATLDDVENAGRLRTQRDTVPGGGVRMTAAYPVILWRPGQTALPIVPMILRTGATERTMQVQLPTINVVSVLPADTTGIEAKPPKDVWGANRVWWPWILAAVLLLLAIAALIWWYRRRRKTQVVVPEIPFIDPRERALEQLREVRAAQLVAHGNFKQHYVRLSEVLRVYAMSVESDWSTDLTTEELAPRLKRRPDSAPLLKLLRSADSVKFARYQPSAAEANADLDAAEAWVQSFNRPIAAAEAA